MEDSIKKENTIEWEKSRKQFTCKFYEIYRGSQTIDSIQYLTSISDTTYIDKNIEAEKDYFYVLKAKLRN